MIRNAIRQGLTALAAVSALAASASALAFTPPPFPRIAGVQYGGPFDYNDSTYQAEMAKQSITLLNYWPGMTAGGESIQSVVQAIKSANPNAMVFLYTDMDEQFTDPTGSADASLRTEIDNMKWWLYSDTTFSSPVPSFYGDGGDTINATPYTPKDSNGEDAVDWISNWFVSNYYGQVPNIDGLFMDNVFLEPRVAGDWYRDGQVLQPSDSQAQAAVQAGYERWFQLVRQLMPGKYQLGNVATWYQPGQPNVPSGYQGMVDGGLMEGLIGQSWSTESWAGWQAMENQYYSIMSSMNSPKLAIFNQQGSPTDYQSMRYGLASCLMNDGYYSFTNSANGYTGVVWFDEYNANLGTATTAPPTGAWQNGVWRAHGTATAMCCSPRTPRPRRRCRPATSATSA